MNMPRKLRCAIYTRKSSEEGLEQDFNSLHAQREACVAYVQSQRQGAAQIPTLEEAQAYAPGAPTLISEACVALWYDKREAVGWSVARMGLEQPIRDWRADLRCFAKTYQQIEQQRRHSATFTGAGSGVSTRSGPAAPPALAQKPACPPMPATISR